MRSLPEAKRSETIHAAAAFRRFSALSLRLTFRAGFEEPFLNRNRVHQAHRVLGGNTNLVPAKARISQRMCVIGGFDQFHHLLGCSQEETCQAVDDCFEAACQEGGSWASQAFRIETSARKNYLPDFSSIQTGFCCVISEDPASSE